MNPARELLQILNEKDGVFAPRPPSAFVVDYIARTPRGTQTRFNTRQALTQIQGAQSETAVRSYLQRRHPLCEIQIQKLEFKP